MTITLDSSLRYWHRRPRSKKRRIRWKWYLNPENWRPDPRVWESSFMFGAAAVDRMPGGTREEKQAALDAYVKEKHYSMHPETWKRWKEVDAASGANNFTAGAKVIINRWPKPFPVRLRKRPHRRK